MDQVIRNLTDGERKAWADPPNLTPDFIVEYKRRPATSTDEQERLIRKVHVLRQAMVRARDEILAIWGDYHGQPIEGEPSQGCKGNGPSRPLST